VVGLFARRPNYFGAQWQREVAMDKLSIARWHLTIPGTISVVITDDSPAKRRTLMSSLSVKRQSSASANCKIEHSTLKPL
jgi:hypothetical protein